MLERDSLIFLNLDEDIHLSDLNFPYGVRLLYWD